MNQSRDAVEAVHGVQRTFMFSVNVVDQAKEKAVDWLLAEQKARGLDLFESPEQLQESEVSLPDNNVLRNGRRLNPNFLRSVTISDTILEHVSPAGSRLMVFELGAGLGHVAHVLKIMHPNTTHVLVDLPNTLFFAYQFLSLSFPEAKILLVTDDTQLDGVAADEYDFVFLPTKFADTVLNISFDLFLNTASLGEMRNTVIRQWMDFLQDRLKVRYLYTLNRYLNVISPNEHSWRLDENECSLLYDDRWKMIRWELEPSFVRCPFVDMIIARYVEILAARTPQRQKKELEAASYQLVEEVQAEDWVRLARSKVHHEMSMLRNSMTPDLGITGTLFKLWESIRLSPSPDNVLLMLRYLERLIGRGNWEFEETDYYERMFLDMMDTVDDSSAHGQYAQVIRDRRACRQKQPSVSPSLAGCDRWLANDRAVPALIEADVGGHNIVLYRDHVLGIPMSLGPINYSRDLLEKHIARGEIFCGRFVSEIRDRILARHVEPTPVGEPRPSEETPVHDDLPLLVDEYRGFNLVQYRRIAYALAQEGGPKDLTQETAQSLEEYCRAGMCRIGSTIADLRVALAEEQVSQAEDRVSETERRATEAEDRASETERRVSQAERRATEAEARTSQTERRVSQAERRATEAERRVSQAEDHACEAQRVASETSEYLAELRKFAKPIVSIILLDWSCRESAHTIDYLNEQDIPREQYELLWIEYYDRRWDKIAARNAAAEAEGKPPAIDQWLILNVPREVYYHKHLMYNVGFCYAHGRIVVICDSDAVYAPSFVRTIIEAFEENPSIVLHLDQVRNFKHGYYPFNYPPIDEIMAGADNVRDGKTIGLLDTQDPLHSRNYGACFAARREDVISIGGSDEHIDYLGHCCGPYDLTFRLINAGKRELWHPTEWVYHVWHPGVAGDNNYVGPHDGKMMSTTAMRAIDSGRVRPLVEDEFISRMRTTGDVRPLTIPPEQFAAAVLAEERTRQWRVDFSAMVSTVLPGGQGDIVVHSRAPADTGLVGLLKRIVLAMGVRKDSVGYRFLKRVRLLLRRKRR
ncbi:MAG: putative sugar O-methyltransferase [Phycisphaerae bacterium]|nr:putative sugar O-methyltransferase [Phycisphaerae bacterium]